MEKRKLHKKQMMSVFVLLFVLAMLFVFYRDQKRILPEKTNPSAKEEIFSKEETEKLKKLQEKLEEILPELGVTGIEFNQRLTPLIELLAVQTETELRENWQKFQEEFAYHYKELNDFAQTQQNLPKEVQESQDKIIQFLQELNQHIQNMNKKQRT